MYTLSRDIFEKICTELLQEIHGANAHNIRVTQGDGGIDILVGDFSNPIEDYQCKFFLDGIKSSQRTQIKNSFNTARTSTEYKLKKWILCVPICLSVDEFSWWSQWKNNQVKKYGIEIALYDGSFLISQLKKYDIYEREFDEDIRKDLNTILEYIIQEKKKTYDEIIVGLDKIEPDQCKDMIFIKKMECAHIDVLPGFKRDFFSAELVQYTVQSKGDPDAIKVLGNLKEKVYSLWETQYMRYANENDGNELLYHTYQRIEDADTLSLACNAIPEVSLISKKGMLHQWAESCNIGWLKGYKEKLEAYLREESEMHGE